MSGQTTLCAKRVCANAARLNDLKLENSGVGTNTLLELRNTNSDVNGPMIKMFKQPVTGDIGNDDECGVIQFHAFDSAFNDQQYAEIVGNVHLNTSGSETGQLEFKVAENDGTNTTGLSITGSATDGVVDVTLGAGALSAISIPGYINPKTSGVRYFCDNFHSTSMDIAGNMMGSSKFINTGTDAGGTLSRGILTNDADDNDQTNLFGPLMFLPTATSDITFTARFRVTSTAATHQGFFIGLTSNVTADFIDDNCAAFDDATNQSTYGIFRKADGGELLYTCASQNAGVKGGDAGVGDALSGTANAVINNWVKVTITLAASGGATAAHFLLTASLLDETTNVTHSFTSAVEAGDNAYANQVAMAPTLCLKAGAATEITYEIDYIECFQTE